MKFAKKGNFDNFGDKLERLGERIGGKLGRKIYQIGNRLEHKEDDQKNVKAKSINDIG